MIRVGFCPPTHLGEIMDLIRSDDKDLIGVVGPSILIEIKAMPAKARVLYRDLEREVAYSLCASLLGFSEPCLFLLSLSWGQISTGAVREA